MLCLIYVRVQAYQEVVTIIIYQNESKRERREEIDIKVRDDILMAISFREDTKKGSRSIKCC